MEMKNVNVGLFGHIDHGKTELAKQLTEIASTSALDKPKESQKRGITIDLGFSSFTLDNYRITLVDAPGHSELIRTAIGAGSIIDAALLVVDAKEGPKTQTGEHLLVLDLLGIPTIVVINKIDIASDEEIKRTEAFMKQILNSTINLKNSKIVKISAKTGIGIEELKKELKNLLDSININREVNSYLKMPIDHAFKIKGVGTVVTGTIHKGKVEVGDTLKILPINHEVKVKSIQCFKQDVDIAYAGDRVGMALIGVEPESLFRGCILTSEDTKLKVIDKFIAKVKILNLFKYNLAPKMKVHINIGLLTVPATIIPYKMEKVNDKEVPIVLEEIKGGDSCYCIFKLDEKVVVDEGDKVLIMRLDLPPTTLRICGFGEVIGFEDLELKKIVVKEGRVVKKKDKTYVEGLASSKSAGEKLIGEKVYVPDKNIWGIIKGTFGTKGSLIVEFNGDIDGGERVVLKRVRRWG
ncbi:selenocysteine-specific translation elongation factor [Methanocaldococcus fervens]|uniref:Selenocysteine-specific elongation factor n=1 Tax=Methanocaldococcus fervens (strain DSM 4213 / JCM 15782 / AG86) TaxID=573064 RepID=C7P7K3_METFA|nr:selenocysteine-specific translation elongation factor [Methanocaldococcus fervens AG86]